MLVLRVTNTSQSPRVWQVEPYGDEVTLAPGDVMHVQYECALSVLVDIDLHPGADAAYCELGNLPGLPETLTLNGQSVWPQRD